MWRGALSTVCLGAVTAALGVCPAVARESGRWHVTLTSQGAGTPSAIACTPRHGCVLAGWMASTSRNARAITCGPSACTSVGAGSGSAIFQLSAWRQEHGSWTGMPFSPRVSGVYEGWLSGVACVNASGCLAVGEIDVRTRVACPPNQVGLTVCETIVPVLERWDGTYWRRQSGFPLPVAAQIALPLGSDQPYTALDAISCATASSCVMVGHIGSTSVGGPALALGPDFADSWSGSAWKMTIMPSPQGSDPQLTSISCVSRGCVAVGSIKVNGVLEPYATEEHNGVWSDVAPNVQGPAALNSVSCVPDGTCFAVGYGGDGPSRTPLVERWQSGPHAGRWITEPVQTPRDSRARGGTVLVSVSCTAGGRHARSGLGSCAAAGSYGHTTREGPSVGWFVESLGPVLPVQTGP